MRIEIVTECEHGHGPLMGHGMGKRLGLTPDGQPHYAEWCRGGSRRVLTEARGDLDAAWTVLTGQPPTKTEMEMGPLTEPTPTELIGQLREAMGLPNYARPDSPKTVWEETLNEVREMRADHCRPDRSCRHVYMTEDTEMEMGPYKPAFGYTEPAELKDDRP